MKDLFDAPDLLDRLECLYTDGLDNLPFGVVAMTTDGKVTAYNKAEARLSGLTPSRVVGRHFFTSVAPCTNNLLVARRFEMERVLDATIDYVFTLRMAPTPVRLRLLKDPGARQMYLIVRPRNDAAA